MKRNLMKYATMAAMTAGMALAQQAPSHSPAPAAKTPMNRPFARARQHWMQALNLSDSQKAQAKAIFQETRQKAAPIRAEMRQNREALSAAVKADNQADIQKLAKIDGALMGRMTGLRAEARAKFYTLLTPEQRATVQKLHAEFRHRMEQRREPRRG